MNYENNNQLAGMKEVSWLNMINAVFMYAAFSLENYSKKQKRKITRRYDDTGNYNDTGLDDRNYRPDDRIWNLCSDIRADG